MSAEGSEEAAAASAGVWIRQADEEGSVFYYNTATEESVWEKPEGFVEPELTGDDAKVRDANTLMVEGKAEEALALYDDVLSRRATAYAIHANRGAALDVLGRWDDALAAFDTALELKEDYTEAHHNRGVVLAKLGRFDEALASHVQATTLRPTFAEAFRGAADAAARLDKFEEAVEYATKALELVPESADAHIDRGFARLKLKDYQGAVDDYQFAYESGKQDEATVHAYATALSQLATSFHAAGDTAGAAAAFKRAVAIKPTEGRCFNLGMTLMQDGDTAGALAACRQAVGFNAENFQAWYMIGALGLQTEAFETALEGFDHAAAVKPDEVECLYNAGFALSKLKRNDEARTRFQAALKVDPTFAPAINGLKALGAPKPAAPKPAGATASTHIPVAAPAPAPAAPAPAPAAPAPAPAAEALATAAPEAAKAAGQDAEAASTPVIEPAAAEPAPAPAAATDATAVSAAAPEAATGAGGGAAEASGDGAAVAQAGSAASQRRRSSFRKPKPKASSKRAETAEVKVYPYSQLRKLKDLPPDVDRKHLEAHLSDEEFAKVMGCSKEEYGDLASFAQMRLKIKAKLM